VGVAVAKDRPGPSIGAENTIAAAPKKGGAGRRAKKDSKNRMKKTRGKEKAKARAAGGKK